MTWEEEVFATLDDLEAQAQAAFAADREAELADRLRAEYAAVPLAARLQASLGRTILVEVTGVGTVTGELDRVADGWFLLRGAAQWLVVIAAVGRLQGLSERAVPQIAWPVTARLGLASALRGLSERRQRCVLHRRDGTADDAVLGRIGQDFLEARLGEVGREVVVPFTALAAVRSR